MSANPFKSTGVTSAHIDELKTLIQALDTKITKGLNELNKKIQTPIASFSKSTNPPAVPAMSGPLLPTPTRVKDIDSIFLGKGGSRRRHYKRGSRRNRRK
jgi:hypothetical protein